MPLPRRFHEDDHLRGDTQESYNNISDQAIRHLHLPESKGPPLPVHTHWNSAWPSTIIGHALISARISPHQQNVWGKVHQAFRTISLVELPKTSNLRTCSEFYLSYC